MINEINILVNQYIEWLRDKTALRVIGDSVEITTPYCDRHNDMIQIYAKKRNGGYDLTDDGYTIDDLEMSGCKLDTPKRQSILQLTLNGFGVQRVGDAFIVHTTAENFAHKKHNLIQAILAVNDLFYLAQASIASLFYEDVVSWLDLHDIRYTPSVKFTGFSNFDHSVHFVIPKSKQAPERLVEPIGKPNKDNTMNVVFKLDDIRRARAVESKSYALLNDSEMTIAPGILEALINYKVTPLLWSEREASLAELAS